MAILAGAGIPLTERATTHARGSAVVANLSALRAQIELYKVQHNGRPPVAYQGTFPQLLRATNVQGVPGPKSRKHPYGPYLQNGVPVNPITGRSVVTAIDSFPPQTPSGNGGWLYHQPTGRIVPDSEGYLDR